jgi:anti-sigma factor ChrR (cupin superfamily)
MTIVSLRLRVHRSDLQERRASSEQGQSLCPTHHPSARLCAEYRIGDVAPGTALAVAAHASGCESCALLVGDPPAPPETLWKSEAEGRKPLKARLPPLLRDIPRTRWRHVSRDVSVCSLRGVSGLGEAVCLLRVAPGANIVLPSHADLILGLSGRASGGFGVLSSGDLIEISNPERGVAEPSKGFLALVVGDDGLYRGPFHELVA